jgi:aminobenzoyl-glutamate utilization protein B
MMGSRLHATTYLTLAFSLAAAQPAPAQQRPQLAALKREALARTGTLDTLTQRMVDQIFSYAELGFEEVETSRYVTGLLERNGFQVERGVAGIPTAWVATYGSGKPVIGFITDLDGIPRASQKPGVAYRDPQVEGAPGHGEGHNSGMAVNVTAALVLKDLMQKYRLPGTLKLYPGVAEEQLGSKAFYVRAGLFNDVDAVLGVHVGDAFQTLYGRGRDAEGWSGVVSAEFTFRGKAAHAAGAPWAGRSALDAVELMDAGWNMRREHLRPQHRVHYVITNGGDQPNVVPSQSTVWYYFREVDYPALRSLVSLGDTMANAAAAMTGTTVSRRILGSAWPPHFNQPIAEAEQRNIEAVGMPAWSDADQTLARALQKELGVRDEGLKLKVDSLKPMRDTLLTGGSDDVGDISWVVPMVYLFYPANIPNLPGHSWADAVAMATPIAHKGSTAGAKVQALTALDLLLSPDLLQRARSYYRDVQTKDVKYQPFIGADDQPAVTINRAKMAQFRDTLRTLYFDPTRYRTYLEQLGIAYPTVRKP